MHHDTSKRGFTHVELVVIIFVLACLLALFFSWVNPAREAARRASCIGTFKMLNMALLNYHDTHKCFPPSMLVRSGEQTLNSSAPIPGSFNAEGNSAGFSWRVIIDKDYEGLGFTNNLYMIAGFPYDDNPDHALVAGMICSARGISNSGGPQFLCPSFTGPDLAQAPEYAKKPSGISNYVALGATHLASLYGTETRPIGGNKHPNGVIYPGSKTTINDIKDGTSNTLMLCETREENYSAWVDGTTAAVVGLAEQTNPSFVLDEETGYYVVEKGTATTLSNIGEGNHYLSAADHSGSKPWTFGPSSFHPGVANHGSADGSVKSISVDIDPTLYMHLITRAGNEAVNEFHTD